MSLTISTSTLSKLNHEITEIRVRALKLVEAKIMRHVNCNDELTFNAGVLMKQLIRWFGQKPLCEEESTLNTIISLLKSKYIQEIVSYLGKKRLQKEFGKIWDIVQASCCKTLVEEVQNVLRNYVEKESQTSSICSENIQVDTIDLCSIAEGLDEIGYELEEPWSTPSVPDWSSMKLLADSMYSGATDDQIQHAFLYLKNAINDYPAEYFLQPPNLFYKMHQLYRQEKSLRYILLSHFKHLTKSLTGRVKMRQLSITNCPVEAKKGTVKLKTQISISNYCNEILNLCIQNIKDWNEDMELVMPNILATYELCLEILDLMENDPRANLSLSSFLVDFGCIVKYFRQTFHIEEQPSRNLRTQYIIALHILSRLVLCSISCKEDDDTLEPKRKQYLFEGESNFEKCSNNSNESLCSIRGNFLEKTEWMRELESATVDYNLMEFYPKTYEIIKKAKKAYSKSVNKNVLLILDCEKILQPTVDMLRQCRPITDLDYILNAMNVIDTLHVHCSTDFVEKLMQTITRNIHLLDGNPRLKISSERIVLRLLAHENLKIKRLAYKLSTDSMKNLFGDLMSGENTLKRGYGKEMIVAKTFGIPLTTEILTEIICFGYTHSDPLIHSNAEMMLCLVLKAKPLLGEFWDLILEVLIPNIPLMQCIGLKSNEIGDLLLKFLDPDNDISLQDIIQGNVRFLFSEDKFIRKEALARLTFILSMHSESHTYLPNISQIIDTVPPDICILPSPKNPEKFFSEGLYDESTIHTLLELLKAPDAEPSIRKTALMQLNIICQDPKLNQKIHDENGWFYVLKILENSLKQIPTTDFTDSAIPCAGILLKILICNPQFRREIANEVHIYFYLIRTLLMFYSDPGCQQDCTIALFLLSYTSYAVGCKQITLPRICSKLKLPVKCDFHWNLTPFHKISHFEQVYLQIIDSTLNDASNSPTSTRSSHINNGINFQTSKNYDTTNLDSEIAPEVALEYIRFSFAKLWFNGMDNFLKKMRTCKNNPCNIDYSVLPGSLYQSENNTVELFETLNFSEKLKIVRSDLKTIECSSPSHNIDYFLRQISNSTTQLDVLGGTTNIGLILLICSTGDFKNKKIINSLRKFLIIPPYNDLDKMLFLSVVRISNKFVIKGESGIFLWLFEDFQKASCLFINYMKNNDFSLEIQQNIGKLVKNWVKMYVQILKNQDSTFACDENTEIVQKAADIFNKLFESVFGMLEENFRKKKLDRVRIALSLLQTISSTRCTELDSGYIHNVIKMLLKIILALKSYTEAGSHLSKNCLYIIGNLIEDLSELNISSAYTQYLSGLCGHMDLEIRALAWSVLEKISKNLKGAQQLVTELAFLPGGFHACCLSTFLDITEASIVRTVAGLILANLLTYTTNSGELDISVAPLCVESEPSIDNSSSDLVAEVFARHKIYDRMQKALESFYVSDIILTDLNCEITTCDIVKTFCSILVNFIDIKNNAITELKDKPCIIRIFEIIKSVPSCITRTSLSMTSTICHLLARFISYDSEFIERILIEGLEVIVVLIHLVDLRFYEKHFTFPLLSIINVLNILTNDTNGFESISKAFSIIEFGGIISVLVYGITYSDCKNLQAKSLEFITASLLKSQSSTFHFNTFVDLLENIFLESMEENEVQYPLYKTIFKRTLSLDSINNNVKDTSLLDEEKDEAGLSCGSEILFKEISLAFRKTLVSDKLNLTKNAKQKTRICESLAVLLKTSPKAQKLAEKENFLEVLILRFNALLKQMGVPCAEYVRKCSDNKKSSIVEELVLLLGIVLNWFSYASLENETHILQLCKIFTQIWPLQGFNIEFRTNLLNCLMFLSEHSVPVCKHFSSSHQPKTVLHLVGDLVIHETTRMKQPSNEINGLKNLFRIISNCCSCIEGRLLITKLNVLDVICRFHPSITKLQKSWNPIILLILQMWEIFSRHPEGAVIKHMHLLCTLVAKGVPEIRVTCLAILRNMSFLATNRPALLVSEDFMYTVQSVLKEGSVEEKMMMSTALWKLVAGHFRSKQTIKNTSIPKVLQAILHRLVNEESERTEHENELLNVIEILLKVLYE